MSQPVLFGNYELLDRIAEGGMAEVWRARSRGAAGFEKTVVIKRVLPALMAKPAFAELLVREAKIAARLSHPNIAQIFDLGEEAGSYFIAMEYVAGRDLGAAMAYRAGHDGLSTRLRVWIVAEAAKALDHAHRRRGDDGRPLSIVHRDVSPQNVLLSYEGHVKVADFGIARADEAGLGRGEDPKILRGKYAYMSPEQARGESLDRRSDVFALGIVLYELLTQRRMFRGKSSQETLALVRAASVPEIDAASVHDDETLLHVLKRCLAPNREDRFAWCGEIYQALMQWLFKGGEPVGEMQLADAMSRMFPADDATSPNKLRVDLLMRAYQDATLAGAEAGVSGLDSTDEGADRTAALPGSRKLRIETRRVAILAVEARPRERAEFERAVDMTGGVAAKPSERLHLATFGHEAGVERSAAHAARAALELRRSIKLEAALRVEAVPRMAILAGEVQVVDGSVLEPEDALVERALALSAVAGPAEVRIEPDLVPDLGHAFRIENDAVGPMLEGFRSRAERDATALRRHGPMVARRAELRSLSEALVAVAAGEHRCMHLVGEPGAGKSRLVAEVRSVAAPRDFTFVTGRAEQAESERHFSCFGDLFRDLSGVEEDDTPGERFAKVERLRVLGLSPREVRLAGELLGHAYPVASQERAGRPRGIEIAIALRKAVAALAVERAVVVVLEDLHWMDDASLQVLPIFLRGLARPRVFTLLTRRPGAQGAHLPGIAMRVSPLGADACGRLFAAALGARSVEPELAQQVARQCGGNPATVAALARELSGQLAQSDGALVREAGVVRALRALPEVLPQTERLLAEARLGQLRAEERSVLLLLSAFERGADVDTVLALEGYVGDGGRRAIDRLLSRRLIVPSPGSTQASVPYDVTPVVGKWGGESAPLPTRVELPSEMLRRAILATLDAGGRERLHARVLAALERGAASASAATLAYHAARSTDRRRAPEYLERAAQEALGEARELDAAEALASASRILAEDGDESGGDRTVALGVRAAELAAGALRPARAAEILSELHAAFGTRGRPAARAAVAVARSRIALMSEHFAEAVEAMRQVQDVLPLLPPGEHAAALHALGRALLVAGETSEAQRVLRESAELARGANDSALRGATLAALAVALSRGGFHEDAEDVVGEALAVAARVGEPRLRFVALASMGEVLEGQGMHALAASRFGEALELSGDGALSSEIPWLALRAALANIRAGNDTEAAEHADRAARLARRRGLSVVGHLAGAVQSVLAVQTHPDTAYVPAMVRAIESLEAERPAQAAMAVELLARAHRALGDPGAEGRARHRAAELAERGGWTAYAATLRATRA